MRRTIWTARRTELSITGFPEDLTMVVSTIVPLRAIVILTFVR